MQRPFIEGTQRDYRFCHRVFHQCSGHLVMHIAVLVPIHNSPSSKTVTPNGRLIVLAERGVMEILRLDWSLPIQSETQYLQLKLGAIAERSQSGDCLRFVSSLSPLPDKSSREEDTKRRQSGYLSPLRG